MHRHRIRAFIAGAGGGETDVPVTIFAAGQYVRYISGVGLMTTSLGPGTTVVNAVTTWGDTTGTQLLLTPVLLDNAGNMTQLVTLDGQDAPRITATLSTASPTTGKLTKWASNAAPWKLDSTLTLQVVTADGADGLYGVSVINGRDPSKWVDGPTPAAATDNAIARWDGTGGRLIQNSSVAIDDSGNLTGVGNINSRDPAKWVEGTNPSITNAIARWSDTTGTRVLSTDATVDGFGNMVVLTLNGQTPGSWVTGPASAVTNRLATFNGTTGKLIQDASSITASAGTLSNVSGLNSMGVGSTSLTSVTALNSITVGTTSLGNLVTLNSLTVPTNLWVRGPTSSTANRIAIWNSTDGRLITDSPVAIDASGNLTGVGNLNGNTWVKPSASGSHTANRIATWVGAGNDLLQETVATVDSSGNFSGGTFNGVDIAAHALRHGPTGADALVPSSEWFSTEDLIGRKLGVSFTSRMMTVRSISSATVGGTLTFASGMDTSLPGRGRYMHIKWVIPLSLGDTSISVNARVRSLSGGLTGVWMGEMGTSSGWANLGSSGSFPATPQPLPVLQVQTIVQQPSSGSSGIILEVSSSGAGFSIVAGGLMMIFEGPDT